MVRNPMKATIVIKFMSDSLIIKNMVTKWSLVKNQSAALFTL